MFEESIVTTTLNAIMFGDQELSVHFFSWFVSALAEWKSNFSPTKIQPRLRKVETSHGALRSTQNQRWYYSSNLYVYSITYLWLYIFAI